MRKTILFAVLMAGWALVFTSCSQGSGGSAVEAVQAKEAPSVRSSRADVSGREEGREDGGVRERKLIQTGRLLLESSQPGELFAAIEKDAAERGGYIAHFSRDKTELSAEIRLPADHFSSFVEALRGGEGFVSASITTEDVTEEYFELETRIENRRLLLEKYRTYLKEARNIEEILSVEEEISSLVTEIENYEGQRRYLADQVEFSTLRLTIEQLEEAGPFGGLEAFQESLGSLFRGFLTFLFFLVLLVLGLVLFGIPVLLVLAFFYYLCFGRLGLVKRGFRRLK